MLQEGISLMTIRSGHCRISSGKRVHIPINLVVSMEVTCHEGVGSGEVVVDEDESFKSRNIGFL